MRISDWSSDVCSSDLLRHASPAGTAAEDRIGDAGRSRIAERTIVEQRAERVARKAEQPGRSEEHTSELQSLMRISYAVFCLKKKKRTIKIITYRPTVDYHTNYRVID